MLNAGGFRTNMTTTPDHKLIKADAEKLAAKYGIPQLVEWVKGSISHWLNRGRV